MSCSAGLPDVPAPDVVLCVVAANNLERNLYLISQVLELGLPIVVALTMVDVAEDQGLRIDVDRLSRQLGVPVVPVQAHRRIGLEALKDALAGRGRAAPRGRGEPVSPGLPRGSRPAGVAAGPEPGRMARRIGCLATWWSGSCWTWGATSRSGSPVTEIRPRSARRCEQARERLAQAGCAVPAIETMARYGWVSRRGRRRGGAARRAGVHL